MTYSYTTLAGFNSYTDIDLINQIQQSFMMFFDWGFLNKGAFTNINLSQTDIRSNDQSKLRGVSDPSYTNGQVWETFRHNLVWESGLATATQPINISGVYVDGSFKTPTTSGYEHYVDYDRGRVIFDAAISTSAVVKMEHSYKSVLFDKMTVNPETQELQLNSYNFTNYTSSNSGDWSTLLRRQMPIVGIEAVPSVSYTPVSLGTGAHWVHTDILLHVIDNSDVSVNKLLSFISLQKEKTIYMLDINLMYSSGVFPLDYRGAKTSDPKTYENLVNGGYRDSQLYFTDAVAQGGRTLGGYIYHGTVRFTTETIAAR